MSTDAFHSPNKLGTLAVRCPTRHLLVYQRRFHPPPSRGSAGPVGPLQTGLSKPGPSLCPEGPAHLIRARRERAALLAFHSHCRGLGRDQRGPPAHRALGNKRNSKAFGGFHHLLLQPQHPSLPPESPPWSPLALQSPHQVPPGYPSSQLLSPLKPTKFVVYATQLQAYLYSLHIFDVCLFKCAVSSLRTCIISNKSSVTSPPPPGSKLSAHLVDVCLFLGKV